MDNKEKIKELQEEIKTLCMEVYGRSGDEIIELIKKADSFFTSGLVLADERDTMFLCRHFIRRILKDKETYGK